MKEQELVLVNARLHTVAPCAEFPKYNVLTMQLLEVRKMLTEKSKNLDRERTDNVNLKESRFHVSP